MDYKDGSYCGNDIVISLTYNCLSWMFVFIGETAEISNNSGSYWFECFFGVALQVRGYLSCYNEASLCTRPEIAGILSQVQGEDGRIFEYESDDDDDGRQAGQTTDTPPVRPAQDERSDRPGLSGHGSVDADRDGPPEATTSTSTGTEREIIPEAATPLHIQ